MSANFQKQLDSILKESPQMKSNPAKSLVPSFSFALPTYNTGSMTVADSIRDSSIFSKIFYLLIGIFVVILIIVSINYLVYPIIPDWLTNSVPIPGMDDSKLFWNTPPPLTNIDIRDQPFSDRYHTYTVMFDVQIDNPTSRSGKSRVFINRGDPVSIVASNESAYQGEGGLITAIVPNFNLIVYCDKISTDMNISCMTRNTSGTVSFENERIKNFPIQKSIRICIVLMTKSMEIYLNGLLYIIHSFAANLNDVKGSINGPIDAVGSGTSPFGRIKNLRLWNRTLMSKEIRKWGAGEPFSSNVTNSDTCAS
jgi:hypothetical protein